MSDLERLLLHARKAVQRIGLDLSGLHVLTEAATGPYAATAAMVGLGGGRASVVAADSSYGTREAAVGWTQDLVRLARSNVDVFDRSAAPWESADIVTNSAPLRPFDAQTAERMMRGSVLALMFAGWELRRNEVDVQALTRRGVRIVGVQERHPNVDVLDSCGVLALKMLLAARMEVRGSRILVVGHDEFAAIIARTVVAVGGVVNQVASITEAGPEEWDAVVHTPLSGMVEQHPAHVWLGVLSASDDPVVVQFAGGLPFAELRDAGIDVIPDRPVPPLRMGWTLSELGDKPTVRLLAGGLRAAADAHAGLESGYIDEVVLAT